MSSTYRKPWTREELILAINLYCKTPFGRIHTSNPDIIDLAKRLERTPGSVSYKLANFASLDPSLPRKGASNVSRLDKVVWQEFFENWDEMAYQSELAYSGKGVSDDIEELPEGRERQATVKARVNQSFFRKTILASYGSCCITGLSIPTLLVASHIIPWSKDATNRTNPRNGLCLNYLHDKAFDVGLLTLSEDLAVMLSSEFKNGQYRGLDIITRYEGKTIQLPKRFAPDQDFLDFHRNHVFKAAQ